MRQCPGTQFGSLSAGADDHVVCGGFALRYRAVREVGQRDDNFVQFTLGLLQFLFELLGDLLQRGGLFFCSGGFGLLAGLEELPVIIKDVDDEQMLALALIENLQRSDLNPVEEAKGYRQLIDASGMTQEALSKAVSKSRSAITNSLRLLDLPEVVQQMIFEGKLTAGHARAILAVPYEDARIKLAEKVVAEGLSVRATENLAPLFSAGETPKTPRPATPQSFKKAARVLRQVFNTNVRVKSSRGKNKIEIEFKDEEELSRILGEMIQFDQGGQDEE